VSVNELTRKNDVSKRLRGDALLSVNCRTLFRARRLPAPIRYAGAVIRRLESRRAVG
jgi:hypothetical protein